MSTQAAAQPAGLLASLREKPQASAVLSDIDGTLAPIVSDPATARILPGAREVLRELAARYALVGCLSGRPAAEARRMVGLDELAYAGNHGLELLAPGAPEPLVDPAIHGRERLAATFADELDEKWLDAVGLWREDKGPIQAFHWRTAADQDAADARAHEVAALAERDGLVPHWGRKVLEVRPSAGIDKGATLTRMLRDQTFRNCLYGGDDVTDLDAFRALAVLRTSGRLETAVCVGITSPEGPSEIADRADIVVSGPAPYVKLLRSLL